MSTKIASLSRLTYPDYMLRASFRRKHAENASTASNIQNSLALEQVRVVIHRITVRRRPDAILQHLLVNASSYALTILLEVIEQQHNIPKWA